MNEMLVIIKAEETISMIKKMVIPFIEVKIARTRMSMLSRL
jgi:hypothetical protein